MRRVRFDTSSLLLVASLLLLFAAGGALEAQSGRRLPKGSAPAPTPEPTPEKLQTAKTPPQPQIYVLVLSDVSQSLYMSVPYPERAPEWVAKRLSDATALAVTGGGRSGRKEAINKAKASKEGFVVFLQVEDSGLRPTGSNNLDEVRISYYIYAPVTGKTQSSGEVYLSQRGNIGIGRVRTLPACYPVTSNADYALLQASLETASRIMSALNVAEPPLCR